MRASPGTAVRVRRRAPPSHGGSRHNSHPNSFDEVAVLNDGALSPYALSRAIARHDHRADDDYDPQPGALYRLMNEAQKKLLTDNIVGAMKSVPDFIRQRQIAHFKKADRDYGARVEKGFAPPRGAIPGRSRS